MKNFLSIKNTPAWLQLIYFFLIALGCYLLFSVISIVIPMFSGNFSAMATDTLSPTMLWIIQTITAIGVFIFPALWFSYARQERVNTFFRLGTRYSNTWLLWGLLWIVSIPLLGYIVQWNAHISLPASLSSLEQWFRTMEQAAEQVTNILLSQNTISGISLNLLIIAVLPAVSEELFFRGVILRLLSEWWSKKRKTAAAPTAAAVPATADETVAITSTNSAMTGKQHTLGLHLAVWVSAIIFSAIHFQFFGFVPRVLLGVLLGYAYIYSGSLLVPIGIHFINNASAVLLYSSTNP
ncbi:MAG: CPBP family intramembrane metalloprotease, partial [Bacteroidales bacterium]|nr:CPBP family intramembrane metalloprotease [Bacteroidales bacterium]